MLRSVALRVIHDQWRAVVAWTLLTSALAAFYLALYPSIGAADEMRRLLEAMPPELRAMFAVEGADLATATGYLNMELFTFVLPLIVAAITIMAGSGATAGEEEHGTLDLLLANPIARWQVVLEKALAGAACSGALCAGVWVGLAFAGAAFDVTLDLSGVAAALISVWLLGAVVGAAALFAGTLTGRRGLSVGVGLVVAVAGFFVNALAPLADVLEPWQPLSPHYHYIGYDPLTNGLDAGHAAVLVAMAAGLTLLAAIAFERRDLRS